MTLPAPGAHQPADPAAARQAVIDTFNKAYDKGVSDDAVFAYFDDAHGFADIMANLRNGPFKEQVRTAVMKLNDLVFLSPSVAAIQYEIDVPNYGTPSFAPLQRGAPRRRPVEAGVPGILQRRRARRRPVPALGVSATCSRSRAPSPRPRSRSSGSRRRPSAAGCAPCRAGCRRGRRARRAVFAGDGHDAAAGHHEVELVRRVLVREHRAAAATSNSFTSSRSRRR